MALLFINTKGQGHLLARLYESTGRAIALPAASASPLALVLASASASALTKMLKFYVKVLDLIFSKSSDGFSSYLI